MEHTVTDILKGAAEMVGALSLLAGTAWWLIWPRIRQGIEQIVEKVNETHHSVTVNGGVSSPPTLRDEVSILRRQVSAVTEEASHFREDMGEVRQDLHGLTRSLATNTADTRDVKDALDEHLRTGERYLGKVEVVLKEHGIELPQANDD